MSDFNPTTPFRTLAQRARIYPDHSADPSRSVLIRVKDLVDDYPERVPFDPKFPRPGRRGGSRPRDQEFPEGTIPLEPPTIYPPPRPRPVPPPTGGPPPTPGGPGPAGGDCFVSGGQVVNSGFIQTNGVQTSVGVSERLIGPAVVVQMGCNINQNAGITAIRGIILVSDDNSTAGGLLTSGERISGYNSVRDFLPKTGWDFLYPYVTINRASFYLKFVCVSPAALGVLDWSFIVCLKRL